MSTAEEIKTEEGGDGRGKNDAVDEESNMEESGDGGQNNALKQAYYISKSAPRQSNRCKWRQKSG